jgi:hypothetical protein
MTRERKGPKVAAQLINRRPRLQRFRELKKFNKGRFGPACQTGLVLGQGFERLLEGMELERGEAFVGEDLGEAKSEFLCYLIRISVLELRSTCKSLSDLRTCRGRINSSGSALTHDIQ